MTGEIYRALHDRGFDRHPPVARDRPRGKAGCGRAHPKTKRVTERVHSTREGRNDLCLTLLERAVPLSSLIKRPRIYGFYSRRSPPRTCCSVSMSGRSLSQPSSRERSARRCAVSQRRSVSRIWSNREHKGNGLSGRELG